ncbi:MAG: hypothetical protein LBI92_04845 [Azoarcus sp.]|jgi:hypothetical protein|nr:hypothetical protein [Azoarcus sp.]
MTLCPFRIPGVQRIAIGGLGTEKLRTPGVDTSEVDTSGGHMPGPVRIGNVVSERGNTDKNTCAMGTDPRTGPFKVEAGLMPSASPDKKPAIYAVPPDPARRWGGDLPRRVEWLSAQGVRPATHACPVIQT